MPFVMSARCLLRTLLAFAALLAPSLTRGETASEATTLALLEQLQERDLPDVMLWVIERAAPECSPDTRRRLEFLKGSALVSQSRVAADTEARTGLLDEAERSIDAFLASSPTDDMAIAAFTQKGSLLVERGRICLALAQRPDADTAALSKEAAAFFDRAIKTLQLTVGTEDDGILGPITLQAIGSMNPIRFVARFNGHRLQFLSSLSTWKDFGRGWANRIAKNLMEA